MKPKRPSRIRFIPHKEISSPRPILCEPISLLELAALRLSPVYYGQGVPRGDGSAVVIIPGLLGMDVILFELHAWLCRLGYRPYFSGMGIAADCPHMLALRLEETIRHAYAETGCPIHLVGHSLGGIFARSAAVRMPNLIASVITLGTPFRGLVVHGAALALANLVRRWIHVQYGNVPESCGTSRCSCAFGRSLRRDWPASVAQTALYSRDDGIVDWRYCMTGDPASDVEVQGTHIGLIFSSHAYVRIAERLSARPGTKKRRSRLPARRL